MNLRFQQVWAVVAEIDPSIGDSVDGEAGMLVAACFDRAAALGVVERVMASGEWGRFADPDGDPSVSDTGWTLGIMEAPVVGEPDRVVHVAFAEYDGCNGGTADGEHFVVLKGFADAAEAKRFVDASRSGGEWGRFDDVEPRSDEGWYLGVDVLEIAPFLADH